MLKENNKEITNTLKAIKSNIQAIEEKPKHDLILPVTEGSQKWPNNSFFIV